MSKLAYVGILFYQLMVREYGVSSVLRSFWFPASLLLLLSLLLFLLLSSYVAALALGPGLIEVEIPGDAFFCRALAYRGGFPFRAMG